MHQVVSLLSYTWESCPGCFDAHDLTRPFAVGQHICTLITHRSAHVAVLACAQEARAKQALVHGAGAAGDEANALAAQLADTRRTLDTTQAELAAAQRDRKVSF